MLVAVTVLAVTLSWLLYHRYPPSVWKSSSSVAGSPSPADSRGGAESNLSKDATSERPTNGGVETPAASSAASREELKISSSQSPETTPKARPAQVSQSIQVPSFSLDSDNSDEEDNNSMPPSFPALNSAQRASSNLTSMGPPPVQRRDPASSQLMPPPPRVLSTNLRPLAVPARSMHTPSTGPLPNRGAPIPGGLAPQSSAGLSVKSQNSRNKVLLTPGHSPLDWANLQKAGKNLSGVSSLIRVTPSQLKYNNGRKGKPAWSSYQGKVYNITPYLPFHPGGEGELRRAAGKDGGKLFMEVHPWVNWENMLGECLVGIVVAETDELTQRGSSLEDMD